MKKVLFLLPFVGISLFAGEMTGYISDSWCGAKNANAEKSSAECAKTCVKNGADPVFVADKDQKVYKISNRAKVDALVGSKVTLTGDVKGETITVASAKVAK